MKYGTVLKGKEGDHGNAVWHCFNLGSLDV